MFKAIIRAENKQYLIIAMGIFAVSLFGIGSIFLHGQEHSYGVSREIPLGLLLLGYAFFVGVSVGLSVIATLSHVFKFEAYHFRSKNIALLSFASLIAAFFLIFWELGGPFQLQILRFVTNYINLEMTSPIWWMSTFYIVETPLLFVELLLLIKGDEKSVFWAGVVGFIVGILAYSTLSMVFAVNAAKPLWHSAQFTISFILGAVLCGGGVSILLMFLRKSKEPNRSETIAAISKMMFFILLAASFIHLWSAVIAMYGKGSLLGESIKVIISGPLSFNYYVFELIIGIAIPMFLLLVSKFRSLSVSALASVCIIIGVFFNRYDGVIGGQMIKVESTFLPHLEYGSYTPTFAEISFIIGAAGLAMVIYELGQIFLPMREEH